jgi:hypothetical protein
MQRSVVMQTHDKHQELTTIDRESLVTASGGGLRKGNDERTQRRQVVTSAASSHVSRGRPSWSATASSAATKISG